MINSIRIEFKKIDKNTRSNLEYEVLVKATDYTEWDDDFFGESQVTKFKTLDIALKNIAQAKELITKAETIFSFIETNKPDRSQIVSFLLESKIHHFNHSLNTIEIYL